MEKVTKILGPVETIKPQVTPHGGDVNFKIPTKTVRKWKEPIHRQYTDEAADIVAKMITKEYDEEKALGFDIKDRNSIINYQLDYCPLGNNILVRKLVNSNLITPEGKKAGSDDKFIVIETSPSVQVPLVKGDVVLIGGAHMPDVGLVHKKIKGISLIELEAYGVAGILISKAEYAERLLQMERKEAGLLVDVEVEETPITNEGPTNQNGPDGAEGVDGSNADDTQK